MFFESGCRMTRIRSNGYITRFFRSSANPNETLKEKQRYEPYRLITLQSWNNRTANRGGRFLRNTTPRRVEYDFDD